MNMLLEVLKSNLQLIFSIIVCVVQKIYNSKIEISTYKYYNIDKIFWLMQYEIVGPFIAQILAVVFAVILGKSTFQYVLWQEYLKTWMIVTIIYLIGIVVIVKSKTEKGKKNYIYNIVIGLIIHVEMTIQLLDVIINNRPHSESPVYWEFIVIVLVIFFNFKCDRIKRIKYVIYTDEKKYYTLSKPRKSGNLYCIKISRKENEWKKMIQIPENKIQKIECIVQNNN